MISLPLFHRIAGQLVIVLGEGDAAEAKRRLVERAGGVVTTDDLAAAQLAFVADDQPEAIVASLKARGVLVNVVDRPELCDFTVPSLLERGSVLVAVGTGGVSAGLAKALRLRLEALLPQSLGKLAQALGDARGTLRKRFGDPADRRRVLDDALGAGGPLDLLDDASAERFPAWLTVAEQGLTARSEFTLQSDDPDDLTLRQARWLGSADVVCHEPGVPESVLVRARADAVRYALTVGMPAPDLTGRVVVIRQG